MSNSRLDPLRRHPYTNRLAAPPQQPVFPRRFQASLGRQEYSASRRDPLWEQTNTNRLAASPHKAVFPRRFQASLGDEQKNRLQQC